MHTDANGTSLPRGDIAARHAARLDACWPLVRVESVDVRPGPAGEHARALVQLGGLTPADVRVELFAAEAPADMPTEQQCQLRMCSTQSYDNGRFVFEATLPAGDEVRAREWMIHVHPSEAFDEPRVHYRFRSGAL